MSWILAFAGFAALIILHELGHFAAAKAVGMRVERFSLFFGRTPLRFQRGETEYGGRLDPPRRLREDHRHEPAGGDPCGGPAARVLPPAGVEAARGDQRRAGGQHRARVPDPDGADLVDRRGAIPTDRVEQVTSKSPAAAVLQKGDRIITVDGVRGDPDTLRDADRDAQVCERIGEERVQGGAGRSRSRSSAPESHARSRRHPSTTPRTSGRCWASRSTPTSKGSGHSRAARLSANQMWVFTTRDRVHHRADLQGREARADLGGRRHLRGDAPEHRPRLGAGLLPARGDLALARRHQPVPVPAARRRPHLLGAGREGARAADRLSASWSARGSSGSRS